jgi:hypothetical protein
MEIMIVNAEVFASQFRLPKADKDVTDAIEAIEMPYLKSILGDEYAILFKQRFQAGTLNVLELKLLNLLCPWLMNAVFLMLLPSLAAKVFFNKAGGAEDWLTLMRKDYEKRLHLNREAVDRFIMLNRDALHPSLSSHAQAEPWQPSLFIPE